jgi:FkbM family methyltransferase
VRRWLRPAYESLLALISRGRGIRWELNGVPCRIDPRHRHRLGRRYEEEAAAFLASRVSPGDVCLDVGANVGAYAIQLARWSRPSGRVYAFEPNPAARRVLARHLRMNDIADRVTVLPKAVGAVGGAAVLEAAGADGMSRLGEAHPLLDGQTVRHRVEVVDLDGWCTSTGVEPDWLVVDVEGFELAVLAGARRLIKRKAGRLGVVVEMHPDTWTTLGSGPEEARGLLASLGVKAVPLSGQTDPTTEYGLVYLRQTVPAS